MKFFRKKEIKTDVEEYNEDNYIPFGSDPKHKKTWGHVIYSKIKNSSKPMAIIDELGCVIYQNSKMDEICISKSAKQIIEIIDGYSIERLHIFFSKEKYRARAIKFYSWLKNKNTEKTNEEDSYVQNSDKVIISVIPVSNFNILILDAESENTGEKMINIDFLTNLKDKTTASEILKFECARTKNSKKKFVFALISIDYLKQLNTECGFKSGNKVIEIIAEIIENATRDVDWCARWFGAEFALFVNGEDKDFITNTLKNINKEIENTNFKLPTIFKVTASIGAKYIEEEEITPEELTNQARKSLQKAQDIGKATVHIE